MSNSLYTYITSPYHSVIFPKGYLNGPSWEHFRTLSSLLSLTPNHIHSPIGVEVSKFIHGNHQFEARLYPDAPIDFIVVVDINPVNSSATPFFDFAKSVKTQIPTYYLRWDVLPCAIPGYLYHALSGYCELHDIQPGPVLKAFETWFTHLLLTQNNLALHLREPRAPYLPPTIPSPYLRPSNPIPPSPLSPTDPLVTTQQYVPGSNPDKECLCEDGLGKADGHAQRQEDV